MLLDFVLLASDSEVASGPMRDKKGWVGIQQAFHNSERQGDLLAEPLERGLKNLRCRGLCCYRGNLKGAEPAGEVLWILTKPRNEILSALAVDFPGDQGGGPEDTTA